MYVSDGVLIHHSENTIKFMATENSFRVDQTLDLSLLGQVENIRFDGGRFLQPMKINFRLTEKMEMLNK